VCCSVLQCVAVCCSVLQCVAVCCSVLQCAVLYTQTTDDGSMTLQHTATHCITLQHTATHCSTLQHAATHLQHTATYCSTLQHTAAHCNTLQHTATKCNAEDDSNTACSVGKLLISEFSAVVVFVSQFRTYSFRWRTHSQKSALSSSSTVNSVESWKHIAQNTFLKIWRTTIPLTILLVASVSRLLKMIGLFCKRALQKRRCSAKETYIFKESTNRSHPPHKNTFSKVSGIVVRKSLQNILSSLENTFSILENTFSKVRSFVVFCGQFSRVLKRHSQK